MLLFQEMAKRICENFRKAKTKGKEGKKDEKGGKGKEGKELSEPPPEDLPPPPTESEIRLMQR